MHRPQLKHYKKTALQSPNYLTQEGICRRGN